MSKRPRISNDAGRALRAHGGFAAQVCLATSVGLFGCRSRDALPLGPTTTSPQATAEPAPLEPTPSRGDEGKERPILATPSDAASAEPTSADGFALSYDCVLGEGAFAARAGETPAATLEALRRRSHTALAVVASGARVALTLSGPRFLAPAGLEVRAQSEHRDYALVDTGEKRVVEAPEGVLRALVSEGRLDVSPLRAPENLETLVRPLTAGGERRVALVTKSATLTVSLTSSADGARWGAVLTTIFAELAGIAVGSAWVGDGEWPSAAEVRWANGRTLRFVLAKKTARVVEAGEVVALPPGYRRERMPLPAPSARAFVGPQDLAQLRGGPAEGASGEGSTLWLVNRDLAPRIALVEGVPVGWVAGNQSLALEGLRAGRYAVRWVSPLGELDSGDSVTTAPSVVSLQTAAP